MSDQSSPAEDAPKAGPRCAHLRAKTMYISGLGGDAGDDAPEPPFYWCNRTLRELGPDGESVHLYPCSDTVRACHQPPPGFVT